MIVFRRLALALALFGSFAHAQQNWTVRPEWVRSHEEFLASDVMAGRGSATRDEQIAATYVASEFMGYGLKPAPGRTESGLAAYLQSAEVEAPQLDGHATLTLGQASLAEGKDFLLLVSSAADVSGTIHVVTAEELAHPVPSRGAILLVASVPSGMTSVQAYMALRRTGAALVMIPADVTTENLSHMFGGKTRTSIQLKEKGGAGGIGGRGSLVAVKAAEIDQFVAQKTARLTLTVHVLPTPPRSTFNAIGYLPGSDPAAGTILLSAHLDHLGIGNPVNGDGIYNGANDDAAGTTAVMELAHALAAGPQMRRSVLFVCYGSEEIGGLGSTYLGEHPPVPLKDLIANLEFEMIGNQDPKMPKGVLLLTGWERSNLGPTLKAHGALLGPDPYPEEHFFERSDNYSLALKGVVAHTAAGWGTTPTYHQPNDDMAHLDLPFMTSAIQSLVEPVRWLASSDFKPSWNPDGQPHR